MRQHRHSSPAQPAWQIAKGKSSGRMLAFELGQPWRGLTSRKRDSPKFAMARAAAPMFSPSCGSTRITTGPGCSIQFFVLSVPAPGMVRAYSMIVHPA